MEKTAAFHGLVASRSRLVGVGLLLLAMGTMLLLCQGAPPAQGAVGKDGQIHACYRVKGKPKGALRVVRSAKARCRRGERKAAWSVAGSSGIASQGAQGAPGQAGANGSNGDEAALKAQIGALSLRVEALEGILQGITNNDLTGMMGVLQGLTNEDLLGAVNSVPAVESLCQQSEALTETVDDLGVGMGSLVSILNGTLLGPIFGTVSIPSALGAFNCPTS